MDTLKIKRPLFPRRRGGPEGRVEHDSRGNAVWRRTRSSDSPDGPDTSTLAIDEDAREASPALRGGRLPRG